MACLSLGFCWVNQFDKQGDYRAGVGFRDERPRETRAWQVQDDQLVTRLPVLPLLPQVRQNRHFTSAWGGEDVCHEMLLTQFSVPVRLRSKFHKFTIAWTAKYGYNEIFRRSWFSWYKPIKSFSSLKASHVRTRSLAGFKGKDQGGNATKRSSMNILSADSAPRVHFLKRNLGWS